MNPSKILCKPHPKIFSFCFELLRRTSCYATNMNQNKKPKQSPPMRRCHCNLALNEYGLIGCNLIEHDANKFTRVCIEALFVRRYIRIYTIV